MLFISMFNERKEGMLIKTQISDIHTKRMMDDEY